jgi:3-keto-disaccharide hydrolase
VTHIINGRTMSIFIDDDPSMAAAQGLIALQIEGAGKVSFRNLWLKNL